MVHTINGQVHVRGSEVPAKWTLALPNQLASPYLRAIVPGFGGFKSSSRILRNNLAAEQSFATLSYGPLRRSNDKLRDVLNPQLLHTDTIEAILDDVAASPALADTTSGYKLDLSHCILDLHSMGGLAGMRYARRHPGEVALLNMIEAVGVEPRVGFGFVPRVVPALLYDIAPPIAQNRFQNHGTRPELARKAAHYYGSNLWQTLGEMASCMLADITTDIPVVRADGTKVTLLYGATDHLIPAKPAVAAAGDRVDAWRIVPELSHLAPQVNASLVARHLAEMTHELLPRL